MPTIVHKSDAEFHVCLTASSSAAAARFVAPVRVMTCWSASCAHAVPPLSRHPPRASRPPRRTEARRKPPPQFCALSHEERGLMSRYSSRSMYQSLELVGVGVCVYAYASLRLSYCPKIGSKTVRRCTVPQPVLTRYKLLKSVSASRGRLGQHRLDGYGRLGQCVCAGGILCFKKDCVNNNSPLLRGSLHLSGLHFECLPQCCLKKSPFFELHNSTFTTHTCRLIILSHLTDVIRMVVSCRPTGISGVP